MSGKYVDSTVPMQCQLLGQKNICLFKLPRLTLIFNPPPDPKSFYGISETQEENVVSKCIYIWILPVFVRKRVHSTPKSSNSRQKKLSGPQ